jgi:hypothetical protein
MYNHRIHCRVHKNPPFLHILMHSYVLHNVSPHLISVTLLSLALTLSGPSHILRLEFCSVAVTHSWS